MIIPVESESIFSRSGKGIRSSNQFLIFWMSAKSLCESTFNMLLILDEAWEYGKTPEKMRLEMLEFLEMGINEQISAEISERVKHKKLN